jgi:hypothetical protein
MPLSSNAQQRLARIKDRAWTNSEKPLPPKVQAYLTGRPAPVAAEASAEVPEGGERRRCDRVTLAANIVVRRLGGFNFEVELKDISASGCKVVLPEACEIGDPVIARLPRIEPLGSRVSWADGMTTGVQFLTVIHPAVFDSLLTRLVPPPA